MHEVNRDTSVCKVSDDRFPSPTSSDQLWDPPTPSRIQRPEREASIYHLPVTTLILVYLNSSAQLNS